MAFFDIVLLIIIAWFGLFGLWFGLVHTVGSLVGVIMGVYLASRFYEPVANWVVGATGWGANMSRVVIFVLAFIIINRLVGLGFWIMDKFLSILTHLPFIKSIDRILGLVFGILEGMIILGIVFYFISRFPLGDVFMEQMSSSLLVPLVSGIASILIPLLPEALRVLKSTVDGVL